MDANLTDTNRGFLLTSTLETVSKSANDFVRHEVFE